MLQPSWKMLDYITPPPDPKSVGAPCLQVFTPSGKMLDYITPRALDASEIPRIVKQFADGARNSLAAGAHGSFRGGSGNALPTLSYFFKITCCGACTACSEVDLQVAWFSGHSAGIGHGTFHADIMLITG